MREDFVDEVSRTLNIDRRDLVEKDLILHEILLDLSQDKFFAANFLFKGGTCLIKSRLGYFRFSEDIDFTWKNQGEFEGSSQKKIRQYLSRAIDNTAQVFRAIAVKRGLDFKEDKGDSDYFEFGGGNKSCTMKIWYNSEILKQRTFLKVQINFVEIMCFPAKRGRFSSLLTGKHTNLLALFPEHAEYGRNATLATYDMKEVLSEKVRAILTREGTKARDFLDVYFIQRKLGLRPEDVDGCVLRKIRFALKLYGKYRTNLGEKTKLIQSGRLFEWGAERTMLLQPIDERDFYEWLRTFQAFLNEILRQVGAVS